MKLHRVQTIHYEDGKSMPCRDTAFVLDGERVLLLGGGQENVAETWSVLPDGHLKDDCIILPKWNHAEFWAYHGLVPEDTFWCRVYAAIMGNRAMRLHTNIQLIHGVTTTIFLHGGDVTKIWKRNSL